MDAVVLMHKCEGRVFLTDRNGFYNDFLADCWQKTKGAVLICLTANRTPVAQDQLTNPEVAKLATQGDQPTLRIFEDKSRIFVWNKQPSAFQQLVLAERILDSVYRQEPVLSPSDIELYKSFLDVRYKASRSSAPSAQLPSRVELEFERQNSDLLRIHSEKSKPILPSALLDSRRKGIGFSLEDRPRQTQSFWSRCFS